LVRNGYCNLNNGSNEGNFELLSDQICFHKANVFIHVGISVQCQKIGTCMMSLLWKYSS